LNNFAIKKHLEIFHRHLNYFNISSYYMSTVAHTWHATIVYYKSFYFGVVFTSDTHLFRYFFTSFPFQETAIRLRRDHQSRVSGWLIVQLNAYYHHTSIDCNTRQPANNLYHLYGRHSSVISSIWLLAFCFCNLNIFCTR